MEEEKAAAYYDELTRKGEGAARFKRGLGFSSCDDQHDAVPQRGTTFVSPSSSFLSSFVRASSPTTASKLEKESQLQSIQHKLKKKPEREARVSARTNVERDGDKHSRRRSRSTSRERYWEKDRERRKRRRSRSPRRDRRSGSRDRRRRSRSPPREGKLERRKRSRSLSPRESWRSERHGTREGKSKKEKNGAVNYSLLIQGYDSMLPPERVKAKMKLQLAEAAEKDPTTGPGWERFEFDKDAPVDDDEIEAVAEDDASLVKHIGQSFRFSAIEKRREEQLKAAHDEAIFGTSTASLSVTADSEPEEENLKKDSNDNAVATGLLSEKVLAKQPGSWRDRVRKA